MRVKRLLLGAGALLGCAATAIAAPTSHQIDFEDINIGEDINTQYLVSDHVTFGNTGEGAFLFGDQEVKGLGTLSPTTIIMTVEAGYVLSNFVFDVETRRNQVITVKVFDDNGLLDSNTYVHGNFGFKLFDDVEDFKTLTGVRRIEISDTGIDFRVDDLNFDMDEQSLVPLPTGAALAGVGLGLVGIRRRRNATV